MSLTLYPLSGSKPKEQCSHVPQKKKKKKNCATLKEWLLHQTYSSQMDPFDMFIPDKNPLLHYSPCRNELLQCYLKCGPQTKASSQTVFYHSTR